MKPNTKPFFWVLLFAANWASAIPILTGDGLETGGASGSFGATGGIYEYRVQGSPGIVFSATQSQGLDGLRLSYAFTAASALSAARAAVYLDASINEEANTWFNERGEAQVATGGATTWEIDEPGFFFGNIFANYLGGAFDNSVFDGRTDLVEDVALGLAFEFGDLGAGDQLLMEILISELSIGAGWGTVLHQWDDAEGQASDNLYIAGRYSLVRLPSDTPDPGVVPEPSGLALMGLGMGMVGLAFRHRRHG